MSTDYQRTLGVIEALTAVKNQCPNGSVRAAAEVALDAVGRGGRDVIREQASFVLSSMRGWRGERAAQIHRSLESFLAGGDANSG